MNARKLLITATVVLVSSLMAQNALAQMPFTNPGPGAGQIVGSPAAPARDLYPVTFVGIDGSNILPRDVLWIEPGKYTLTISARITNPKGSTTFRRTSRLEDSGLNEIEVVIEAGKTYHIAALYDGEDNKRPYSTVVHRVEAHQ